jgi:hypothetical protein
LGCALSNWLLAAGAASHSTAAHFDTKCSCCVFLQGRLLELLDFRRLPSGHLVNQLVDGEADGLTNLNELHGRRLVVLGEGENPLLVEERLGLRVIPALKPQC